MKRYINYILLVFLLLFFLSCGTKELFVGYSNTCFNANNEIVYIKFQTYKYFFITLPDSMENWDSYDYLCKMDLDGNEEVIDIVPENISVYHFSSSGNGRICIQTIGYDAYTYIDGEFTEILSDDSVINTIISYDGEKIMYTNTENDTFILTIADINGSNKTEYGVGFVRHWHPDNEQVVYSHKGNFFLLDTTTSNTQTLPYAYHWSHDLQRIAYYDETDHLVLMNWDTTGQVVTDWMDKDHRVVWSYDGEYLLSGMNLLDKNGNLIRTLREKE